MVFLDSSHPEQWKRLEQKEMIPNSQINFLKVIAALSALGLRGVYNKIVRSKPRNDGLPQECHIRNFNLASSVGKVYRRNLKENRINDDILKRAGQASDLDSLPILVFTATEQYGESQKEKYRNQGIEPDKQIQLWFEMQKELKELSTEGKQFVIDASHGTIITKKENAEIINKEVV